MSAATRPAAPTSNPVAEAAIIAGLVNCGDPAAIGRYALDNRLDAECFTLPAYRDAYAVITDLAAGGQPVDPPILAQHLDHETLATVDAACREHVSRANFDTYANQLHKCKRSRAEAAAWDRLFKAREAGALQNELDVIYENIRATTQASNTEVEPRFQWADEFCRNRPDTSWLVDDHIPACSVGVLFGDSETWKTFLLIDIAGCIATGRRWRGKEVKQGNVLFIAGEGGYGLRARIQAWFDYHNEPMRHFAVSTVPLELCDPKNADALIADIRRFAGNEQFVFIVLDTLSTHFGSGDENAPADMNKFRRAVLKLSKATDAAVAIIHHPGHNNKDREKGAITLRQGIDWGYRVERVGEVTTITTTKMKDAPPPSPMSWTLKPVPLPWADAKGKSINGAVLVPVDSPAQPARKPHITGKARIALDALRTALMTHGAEDMGVVSVSEDEWRQAAYDAGIASSDATQNAKRMAFNRAREALLASTTVTCDAGRYWIPHPRTKTAQTPAQTPAQAECAAEIQRTPAQDRTNRSKNEQSETIGAEKSTPDTENDPRTDRTRPHKTAQCADVCGSDIPSVTSTPPAQTAHTSIEVCGCAGVRCAEVPHSGLDSKKQDTPLPALDSNPQQQPAPGPAPDLETLLAAEVGIDRDRMMAGRLRDDEWPTLITAHDRLAARLPADERPGLRALLDQIDAMAGQAVEP